MSSKSTALNKDIIMYKAKNSKNRKSSYESFLEIKFDKGAIHGLCKTKRLTNLKNKYSSKASFIVQSPKEDSEDQRWTFVVKSKNYQLLKCISEEILDCYYHFITTIYKIQQSLTKS